MLRSVSGKALRRALEKNGWILLRVTVLAETASASAGSPSSQ